VAAGSNAPVYSATTDLELTESGGAAVSWDWSGPNGFVSADQNPMIANPAAVNSGNYTVVVTGPNGCTNAAVVPVVVSILSITCPGNVNVDLGSGECGAVVNNILPIITGGAGGNSVLVTSGFPSGFPSGSEFPIGTTTNCYQVTDAQNNMATCCFDVTVEEFPNPIASLICNDLVPISLALPDCQYAVPVDTILEGGPYRCFDHYILEIDNIAPLGNGPWVPAVVGVADIGQTYQIRVTDPDSGNKCWGNIFVQDVLPPQMQCSDITVDCGPAPEVPPVVTDCQTYTLSWTDQVVQNTPPTTPFQVITRTWTAEDAGGLTSVCTQTITIQYPSPDATITTSAAAQVCPGTTGYTASVPNAGPGATYTWTILNGTITGGQGTNSITYNVDGVGQTVLSVTVVSAGGCYAAGCNNTFIQSLGNMGGSQPNIFPHPNGDFFATGLRNDSMVIVRFDPLGTPLWARAFVLGTNTLLIRDMLVDASGDLIGVAYYETGFASQAKSTVFRYNIATHSFVWVQHISEVLFTNIHDFDANNCVLTGTGNGGYTQLAHIDKSTGAVSTYALQGEGGDYYSVMQNGHLYGACRRYYNAGGDFRVGLFSHDAATGAFEWQNSLISVGNESGPNQTRMYPEKPALDNDSLVVIASGDLVGFDLYFDGPTELVVAKTDLVGNVGWTKQYLVSGYDRPVAARIANTADGYYIVANMYLPGLSNFGFGVLIKTDKRGNVQWAKRLGISGKNIVKNILERNGFLHLMMASDSYTPDELLLLKLDLQGNSSIACDFIQPIVVSAITMTNIQNARPYTVSNRTNILTPLVETPNPTPFSNVSRCSTPCSNSLVVNVALPDAGNIAGPVTLCSGSGFQYTSSGLAGGIWGSDDPGVAYVDAGTGDVFALAPGFCTITYTVTENGCTNTAYFFLEVLSSPYVEAVSNSPVCAGGDAVLAEIGGDAATWYWYDPNGSLVSNAQTFTILNVSPADEGLYVVAAYAANGCVGYAQTPVFLSGPASAGTISGSATVCQGKNTPLSIIGTPGGMWSSSNTAIATVNSVSGVVQGVSAGIVVITYTVSANGCTETADFNMEVKPRPAVAISGVRGVCENETLILTETGGDAVSWVWSNGLGFVTTDQTLTFFNPLYAVFGGFANVSVTDANGCTNSLTVDAGAQPLPAVLATSNAPICPGSGNLELFETGGAQGATWAWSGPGGYQSLAQNPVIPNPTPANSGDYTVVVTDWTGCMNSQTIQVAITYPEPIPVLVAMPDLITCNTTPVYATTALDPCNINTVIYGTPSGPATLIPNSSPPAYLFSPGMYVVTWTYNLNGVIVTQPQLITIHAQPNVTCPSNSTTCLAAGPLVLSGGAPAGGAYSGPGVNAGVFDPAVAGLGQHTITYTYTNGQNCTNTCTFTITVVPGQLPAITCPGPVTVPCAGNIPAPDPGLVAMSGGCGTATVDYLFTSLPYDVDCANRFSVTRYYQATDASNNTVSCSQVITVFDDTKPNFTFVPANVTVQCNSLPAVGNPTATDNCGGAVGIAYDGQTRVDGSCTDSYTLTRQWTATDGCGNTRTATQRISVIDTQKPAFVNPPANITVQCSAIPTPVAPVATDNCDANVGITYVGQTRTNGACANAYTLTRRWVASDNCNNTRSISQRITVVDNGKPTLTIPPDQTIACNVAVPTVGTATATDGCGGTVNILYLGQTSANATCPGNYQLRRTWRATDACGNSTVATQTIQVADNQQPIFTSVPVSTTIQCTQAPPLLSNPVATDNCGGFVNITYLGQVRTDGNCLYNYTLTRTWRATDLCGNAATTVQVITVQDTAPPVFSNIPASVTVACAPNCVPPPAPPTATDNCGSAALTMLETQSPGDCATGYTVTRTWTATDQCGNPSTCAQTFTVLPTPFAPLEDRTQGQLKTQNSTLKTVSLLPNPTTDRVWIDLGDFAGETVLVSIQNDLGQRIWERRVDAVPDLQLPVDLREAGAAAGLYTVSVRSGGQVLSGRLVLVE
jgi:hypothetical protein